jgi:MFS family permease
MGIHKINVRLLSIIDVFFWSIMIGLGETYISAFSLSFGFSERYSGLVGVIPFGLASIIQIFSTKIFSRFRTRKNIVVFCAFMQALCLFSLILQPNDIPWAKEGLIVILIAYWFFGMASGPFWNAWLVSIIPSKKLPDFFAKRGMVNQLVLIATLVGAGHFINVGNGDIKSFNILFFIAGIARLFSAFSLMLHPEEEKSIVVKSAGSIESFRKWILDKNVSSLILVVGIFRLGVAIGAPYFTSFFIVQMKYSYLDYSLAIIAPFISRALFFRYSEKMLHTFGIQKSLIVNIVLVSLLPLTWSFEPSLNWLIFSQLLSGIGWGGFEYAVLFRQIEDFEADERSRVLLWTNFVIGICSVVGVVFGSFLLGKSPTIGTYKELFYLSTVVRFSPIFLIFLIDWKSFRKSSKQHFMRIIGVRPNKGPEIRPIIYVEDEANDK